MDLLTYAEQQLGLLTTTAIANHILQAHKDVKSWPPKEDETPPIFPLLFDGADYLSSDTRHNNDGVGTDVCVEPLSSVLFCLVYNSLK